VVSGPCPRQRAADRGGWSASSTSPAGQRRGCRGSGPRNAVVMGMCRPSFSLAWRSCGGRSSGWLRRATVCGGLAGVRRPLLVSAGLWQRCATVQGRQRGGGLTVGGVLFPASQDGGRLTLGVDLLRVEAGAVAPGARWWCCYASGRVGGRACFRWRGRRLFG
jgi:hypothetical protein